MRGEVWCKTRRRRRANLTTGTTFDRDYAVRTADIQIDWINTLCNRIIHQLRVSLDPTESIFKGRLGAISTKSGCHV